LQHHLAVEVELDESREELLLRATYTSAFGHEAARTVIKRMEALLTDPGQILTHKMTSPSISATTDRLQVYDEDAWTAVEKKIRKIAADLCNVNCSNVKKNVSFLRLGLDSISSIRFSQRLRREGVYVAPSSIMANATVGSLASFAAKHSEPSTSVAEPVTNFNSVVKDLYVKHATSLPVLAEDDKILSVHPATPMQMAMLTTTLATGGNTYVIMHPLRLGADVDIGTLRSSWERVASKTQILQTTFHPGVDVPWIAAIHQRAPLSWTDYQLSSQAEISNCLRVIKAGTAITSIEGFTRPPISVHLIHCPDVQFVVPVIHHRCAQSVYTLFAPSH
jgi:aryl carrier-like protein